MSICFNALCYHYPHVGEARKAVIAHEADGSLDREGRTALARLNFQGSLIARCVMENPKELMQNVEHSHTLLDDDAIKTGTLGHQVMRSVGVIYNPTLLLEPFFRINMLNATPALIRYLDMEVMTFMVREWMDVCCDLETEKKTGHPTPNVITAYLGMKYPDMSKEEMHGLRGKIKAVIAEGLSGIPRERFIKADSKIAEAMEDFDEMYQLKESEINMNADLESKAKGREALGEKRRVSGTIPPR